MNFGWGMGEFIAISGLAMKVYTAYKHAPNDYRHISNEVRSLQIIINKATRYFRSTALSDSDRQEGLEVLKGCRDILEDLNSLIEKYNRLVSANPGHWQVLKWVKLGTEDITALRVRLNSNTGFLNSFIQRFDILLILFSILG